MKKYLSLLLALCLTLSLAACGSKADTPVPTPLTVLRRRTAPPRKPLPVSRWS